MVKEFPTVAQAEAGRLPRCRPCTCPASARTTRTSVTHRASIPRTRRSSCTTGTSPTSKIVGLSYLVWHHGGPPPGFAGPNDRWHQHNANGGLCLRGGFVIAGEESTRQQCAAWAAPRRCSPTSGWSTRGSRPIISCAWGTFSGECPDARRQARRYRLRRSVPEQDLLSAVAGRTFSPRNFSPRNFSPRNFSPGATRPSCAAAGSPSRRVPRGRRASRCRGPSRGPAVRG